jgi:succinyl-diaminopimelate desuccinylase
MLYMFYLYLILTIISNKEKEREMGQFLEENKEVMIRNLAQLIGFSSVFDGSDPVHPFGVKNTEALEFMLALGRQHGFKTANLDNEVGYIEYGEGQDYVAVLTHLDVVPVGNGWTKDPFGGEVVDGKMYGRGTLDDKGPAMSAFYGLLSLKAQGFVPKHRIRLIMGLNEESGSKCMAHYVQKEPQPVAGFTPDGEFPVIFAEKGILGLELTKTFSGAIQDGGLKILSVEGGIAGNMVPDYCKAVLEGNHEIAHIIKAFNDTYGQVITLTGGEGQLILEARGKGAHASMPEKGINAISHMMQCLNCLDLEIGDTTNFVRGYARRIGLETDGTSMGLKHSDDVSGDLTLNVGVIKMATTEVSLVINIRYPVTLNTEIIFGDAYKDVMDFEKWTMETKGHSKPLYKDQSSDLIQKLMGVYIKHTGDSTSKPIAIGGGTYARSMDNTVAFGIMLPHMEDLMHQADEYIVIEDLYKITEILEDAMRVLAE